MREAGRRGLQLLRASDDVRARVNALPTVELKQSISTYECDGELYSLKREFVDTASDDPIANVCGTCHSALRRRTVPRFCIAAGYDFGTRPPHLPELTLAEEMVIALARPYLTVLKLTPSDFSAVMRKYKGHVIVFEHDAVAAFMDAVALPRTSLPAQMVCVALLGKRESHADRGSLRQMLRRYLEVRYDVVMAWLQWLKAVNPLYCDVAIVGGPATAAALQCIDVDVIARAVVVDDEQALTAERVLAADSSVDVDLAASRRDVGGSAATTQREVGVGVRETAGSPQAQVVVPPPSREPSPASQSRWLGPTFSWLYIAIIATALGIQYPLDLVQGAAARLAAGDVDARRQFGANPAYRLPRGMLCLLSCYVGTVQ